MFALLYTHLPSGHQTLHGVSHTRILSLAGLDRERRKSKDSSWVWVSTAQGEGTSVRRDTCSSLQSPEPAVSVGHRPLHPAQDRIHRNQWWEGWGKRCWDFPEVVGFPEAGGWRLEPILMTSEKGDCSSHLLPGSSHCPALTSGPSVPTCFSTRRGRGSLASAGLLEEEDVVSFFPHHLQIQGTEQ